MTPKTLMTLSFLGNSEQKVGRLTKNHMLHPLRLDPSGKSFLVRFNSPFV